MIFPFEDADASLTWMPLAARRALDRAGRKLSLRAWQELSMPQRRALVMLGAMHEVDAEEVRVLIRHAEPPPAQIETVSESVLDAVPEGVCIRFARWTELHPLARFVLSHYGRRRKETLLATAKAFFEAESTDNER